MAVTTPFRTTPQLGPKLSEVYTEIPYWDTQLGVSDDTQNDGTISPSYKVLNKETGNDGADYIWVKASAAIAATASTGTQVAVTADGTAAAGNGGWYAPVAGIASGAWFHARSKAWNAY